MRRTLAISLLLAMAGCSAPNDDIECPAPESGATAGTLAETSKQIAAAGTQLGRGSETEIAEAAAAVRSRHPAAAKDEVINYLVTAYCPRINREESLSRTAKRQALDAFSARAERIVH